MKLAAKNGSSVYEWEGRKLHVTTTYACSLALVVELDPRVNIDKVTYVFSTEELTTTLSVLQDTAESVQGCESGS